MSPTANTPDHYRVFKETCLAAGVDSGSKRLEIFLGLSEPVRKEVFADLAHRLESQTTHLVGGSQ